MTADNPIGRLFPSARQPAAGPQEVSAPTVELRPVRARRSEAPITLGLSEWDEVRAAQENSPMPEEKLRARDKEETQSTLREPLEPTQRLERVIEQVRVERQPVEPRPSVPSVPSSPKPRELVAGVLPVLRSEARPEERSPVPSPREEPQEAERKGTARPLVVVRSVEPPVVEPKSSVPAKPPVPSQPEIPLAASTTPVTPRHPTPSDTPDRPVRVTVGGEAIRTESTPIQLRQPATISPSKPEPERPQAAAPARTRPAAPAGISVRIDRIEIVARASKPGRDARRSVRRARSHQIEPRLPIAPGRW